MTEKQKAAAGRALQALRKKKSGGTNGGRPRSDAPRCACGLMTVKCAAARCHVCKPASAESSVRRSDAEVKKYAKSAEARATSKRLRANGPDPSAADLKEIPELTPEQLNAMYRP